MFSTATISNFTFSTVGDADPNAPSFPFFNFEDCWGYITGEDKAAPDWTARRTLLPAQRSLTAHHHGYAGSGRPQMDPTELSCFLDGGGTTSSIDAGQHYYDLIPFQVDRTDYYTILVSDDFGSTIDESAIAIFAGATLRRTLREHHRVHG